MDAGQIRSQPEASQWEALPTSVYLRLCLARGEEAPCVFVCVWKDRSNLEEGAADRRQFTKIL